MTAAATVIVRSIVLRETNHYLVQLASAAEASRVVVFAIRYGDCMVWNHAFPQQHKKQIN